MVVARWSFCLSLGAGPQTATPSSYRETAEGWGDAVLGFTVVASGMSSHAGSSEGGTPPGGPFTWAPLWIRSSPTPAAAGCFGEIGINVTRSALASLKLPPRGPRLPQDCPSISLCIVITHWLASSFTCVVPSPPGGSRQGDRRRQFIAFSSLPRGLQKYPE